MLFLQNYKITQVYIHDSLNKMKKYFTNFPYKNLNDNTLFIGLFKKNDITKLEIHKGKKFILWLDNDCNPYYKSKQINVYYILRNIKIERHFVNSLNTCRYLNFYYINYELIYENFNSHKIDNYKIFAHKKLYSIAENLNENLISLGYTSEIIGDFSNDLECKTYTYIIIYVKYFTELLNIPPRKYILYQMEQNGSNMFNLQYESLLNNAYKIFDFSKANNFYFTEKIKDNIFYNPFPLSKKTYENNSSFDILFYGQFNERRLNILKFLNNIYDIKYVENIIGNDRDNLIKKCKIVLNIHFYENACLETCRINEVLKFKKIVISEIPNNNDYDNKNLYNNVFYFDKIKSDLSNINLLTTNINYCLKNYNKIINDFNIDNIYKNNLKILDKNIKSKSKINKFNNSNIIEYINITNPKKWIYENYILLRNKVKDNLIDIDYYFYKKVNNIKLEYVYELLCHLYINGLLNGLIYHQNQLKFTSNKISYINNKFLINEMNIDMFLQQNYYNLSYLELLNSYINIKINTIEQTYKKLLIICFIGNLDIGITLINKINNYSKIQDFHLCLIIKQDINDKILLDLSDNKMLVVLKCKNIGNDIMPSIFTYELLDQIIKFDYIIKLHTKSDKKWFNETTNFLLDNKLDEILKYKNNNCNCIGHPDYLIKNNILHCTYLMNKYKKIIKYKYFIKGSIFLCKANTFKVISKFISDNFKMFIFQNTYDSNCINEKKSSIHFLERLFGMIDIS